MQSQIAEWEQREVLCPLLASSPPAPDLSQQAYKFFSSTHTNFNPFTATAASFGTFASATPQKQFEAFGTPTATQAAVFDTLDHHQSYVNSLLQSTISSNTNPNSAQQFVANPLAAAQATNANLTEYLKNIAALNANSAATTTTAAEINRVLSALQPSTPTTAQLLNSTNVTVDAISVATSQFLNANNANTIGQSALIATNPSIDPTVTTTNNPFAQPQQQAALAAALLSNGLGQSVQGAQQQSSSIQTTTNSLANEINTFLSNSLLHQQQKQSAAINDSAIQQNPFLAPAPTQQTTTGAFKFVGSPQNTTANLLDDSGAAKTGFSLYSPQLTEALKMLRSPIRELPAPTKKPIPLNSPIDLASFRIKDPQKWTSDDVVAWVLDVARRHNIPREEIGVIEFGSHNGMSLTRLTEQNFKEINSSFGVLMYIELHRLLNDEPINTIDDLIRYCKSGDVEDERPSTSRGAVGNQTAGNLLGSTLAQNTNTTFGRFLSATSPLSPLVQSGVCNPQTNGSLLHHSPVANVLQLQQQQDANLQQLFHPHLTAQGSAVASVFAQQRKQLNDLQQQQQQMLHAQQLLQKHSPAHHPLSMQSMPGPSSSYDVTGGLNDYGFVGGKIRKNKDGRPRKRSQHTKGNKLWEFIRDALKDPSTCPTVVRWEDPDQGVFRIIESEKLARLWGEKKNNQKMTYEKLSRAMRTYYEKQILVPVPKTGLYPKKLVYKFGPGAHGWHAPPHLAHACLKLQQHE